MTSFVTGQLLSAAALNAALALYYPAGNVSNYSSTLLNSTSGAAWLAALGLPAGAPGSANGLATLDSTGRLPASQLTAAVVGAMVYQGTWNASTNTPALASGVGTKGQYYQVSTAGTTSINGISQWNVGDIAVFNGSAWQKIDGVSSEVTSVVGQTGAVTAAQIMAAQSAFTGDSGSGGAQGLVPAPPAGSGAANFVLGAGGSWVGQNLPGGFVNKFRNGTFDVAQRGSSGSVAAGTPAYTLDGWQISATGAAAAWSQTWSASGHWLNIECATGLTNCQLVQRIESYVAEQMMLSTGASQPVTVQWEIANNTAAAITPTLAAVYMATQDDAATNTADLPATNLQTIAAGAHGVVSYTFTPNAGMYLGYELILGFGGQLNASSGAVLISRADIRATPGVATGLNNNPPPPELRPVATELAFCQRYLPAFTDNGSGTTALGVAWATTTTSMVIMLEFPVPTRVTPTGIVTTGISGFYHGAPVNQAPTSMAFSGQSSVNLGVISSVLPTVIVAGVCANLRTIVVGAQILFTGCEL